MRKSPSNVARRAVSASVAAAGEADRVALDQWARLAQRERLNPCNSPLHPAAKAGVVPPQPGARALSVQEAYDPQGIDFACGACRVRCVTAPGCLPPRPKQPTLPTSVPPDDAGPAHPTGLRLRSFRTEHGLQSHVVVPDAYQASPCGLLSCAAHPLAADSPTAAANCAPTTGAARHPVTRHFVYAHLVSRQLGGAWLLWVCPAE